MSYRLGFAVKVLSDGGLSSHDTRRWQSGPHLSVSLERLGAIFDYLEATDVRISNGLGPGALWQSPEMDRFHGQVEECEATLALGARARAADLRLSFHPGQYAVLNSEDEGVRAAAAADVELQASVLETMGLGPEAVVVLHVGGVGGNKAAAIDRFLVGFEGLSELARTRLVIENDDGRFGLGDVVGLSERSGLRIVWDALHH